MVVKIFEIKRKLSKATADVLLSMQLSPKRSPLVDPTFDCMLVSARPLTSLKKSCGARSIRIALVIKVSSTTRAFGAYKAALSYLDTFLVPMAKFKHAALFNST